MIFTIVNINLQRGVCAGGGVNGQQYSDVLSTRLLSGLKEASLMKKYTLVCSDFHFPPFLHAIEN